jgi:PAS domain S-box-containing protein
MQPMPSVTPMSTERPFPRGQVVVCQYDFNFHLTYVNPAFARMLGYSREELVGQPLKRIAHPGIPQALLDDIRATTGRGQPWRGMAKTLRRDGGYVWSESLIIPVLKRGEVTGYMSIRSEASPQRIAAEEQRYRDIHAGARRYHEGRGPDWTRVTLFFGGDALRAGLAADRHIAGDYAALEHRDDQGLRPHIAAIAAQGFGHAAPGLAAPGGGADVVQQRLRNAGVGNAFQRLAHQFFAAVAQHAGKRRVDVGQMKIEVILAHHHLAARKRPLGGHRRDGRHRLHGQLLAEWAKKDLRLPAEAQAGETQRHPIRQTLKHPSEGMAQADGKAARIRAGRHPANAADAKVVIGRAVIADLAVNRLEQRALGQIMLIAQRVVTRLAAVGHGRVATAEFASLTILGNDAAVVADAQRAVAIPVNHIF